VPKSWDDVEQAIQQAIKDGWLADWRGSLPTHPTKRFRKRKAPSDILGVCSHHGASVNQDPQRTADYHTAPGNHVSDTGCPGILYTLGISTKVEPEKVLLFQSFRNIPWSQGARGEGFEGDENRHLASLLVFGDFDEVGRSGRSGSPTASQMRRWQHTIHWLQFVFDFSGAGCFGHFDFGKSYCPGKDLREETVAARRMAGAGSWTDFDWQRALLRWDPGCLPRYGADGVWGSESRRALVRFEREHKHRIDGIQDPFTELLLHKLTT